MKNLFVTQLEKIEDIKNFVNLASLSQCDVFVGQDEFKVSGKSIMGVFSLDLSRQIIVETEDNDLCKAIKALGIPIAEVL